MHRVVSFFPLFKSKDQVCSGSVHSFRCLVACFNTTTVQANKDAEKNSASSVPKFGDSITALNSLCFTHAWGV